MKSGFVNRVFSDTESMITEVMDIAKQIASHSPLAVTGTKQMINFARDHGVTDGLNLMATWQAGMFQQEDMRRALEAQSSGAKPSKRMNNSLQCH